MSWEKLRGKIVVLDFWGTWCGPCINDMPLLMDLADQFRDQPIHWLSIHTPNLKTFDELDREIATWQEKSWNKRALPFTTVIDRPAADEKYSGQTSRRYGVAEWPTLIVVDQQGQVVGPISKKRLAETISRLLGDGTGVRTPSGCRRMRLMRVKSAAQSANVIRSPARCRRRPWISRPRSSFRFPSRRNAEPPRESGT